jgi:hypothetical protein
MFSSINLRCGEEGTVDGGPGEIKTREANFGVGVQTGEMLASNQTLAGMSDQKEIEGLSLALAGDL